MGNIRFSISLYRAEPTRHPKRHLDQFSRFCTGPKCYDVQWIVDGKKPELASSPWHFVTPPENDRATATGDVHEKMVKNLHQIFVQVV